MFSSVWSWKLIVLFFNLSFWKKRKEFLVWSVIDSYLELFFPIAKWYWRVSTLQPSSIFYVHIFIARVNLKLLLFIFGHIRKWEIDKISLINAIKWGASILVNEISVYKGRLLDTFLNRSRSRPRTDVHLFHRSSSILARKKIWSRFVRDNYDSDLINSSNEMTPKKDIICENVCFVDPILSIANNWTNNNVFFYKKKSTIHSKVFF